MKEEIGTGDIIIAGDFNLRSDSCEYKTLSELIPSNIKDIYYLVNQKHDPTFGLLDENGQPTETLMTFKTEYGIKWRIDYIFSNLKPISICLRSFEEDDLKKRKYW